MNKNLRSIIPVGLYFFTILSLFLYSFTQIDLSLTFSRIEFLRNLVTSFQYVGYFNRLLSTYLFAGLYFLLFGFYFYFIRQTINKKHNKSFFWKIILATTAILVLSYNAFSHDLFNYIFDAKIFTHYNLNPYLHKALDFPGDPMLSFMHWTHRVYPYGPVWLMLTIPLSFLGQNFFLPTFFLFKFLIAGSYLGSVYFIGKILRKINPAYELFGTVVFALNPLVITEALISAHLDMVMIFFALFALFQLINKKYLSSFLLLFLSIGIKFATISLLPVFLWIVFQQRKEKKVNWELMAGISTMLLTAAFIAYSVYSTNFQPWYLLLPFVFVIPLVRKYNIFIPVVVLSVCSLSTYMPYLYLGNWNKPVPEILLTIYTIEGFLSVAAFLYPPFMSREFK